MAAGEDPDAREGMAVESRSTQAWIRAQDDLVCRVCGSAELRELGRVRGFRFVECARCAFSFAPAVSRERMADLYTGGYHGPERGAPSHGWGDTGFLEPALQRLRDAHPLRILDFGTGQSLIPEQLRRRGHRVVAVDVAPPLRPHPDRLTGVLREMALPARQFDLVYSFQVFEHLPEPVPELEELLRLTRPGGLVAIHTDMEVPEREAGFQEWWYVMPPDHCAFYRHRTFHAVLEGTPHRVAACAPKYLYIEAWADAAERASAPEDTK